MTTGYEKRKLVDEEMRYKHGYDRGLKGHSIIDRKGHTEVYLRGIADGLKVSRKVMLVELANQAAKLDKRRIAKLDKRRAAKLLVVVERRDAADQRKYLQQLDEALERATAAKNRGPV